MTSILFLTQAIHCKMQFSMKRKTFSESFFAFSEFIFNFKHFQKKMTLIAHAFLKLRSPKNVVRYISKKSYFRGPFTSNMVNGPKHCSKLNDITFTIFIDPCEGNSV